MLSFLIPRSGRLQALLRLLLIVIICCLWLLFSAALPCRSLVPIRPRCDRLCVRVVSLRIVTFASTLTLTTGQVLVQEFLVGTEYVVDTVSRDGNHKVLLLVPKGCPFVESTAVLHE